MCSVHKCSLQHLLWSACQKASSQKKLVLTKADFKVFRNVFVAPCMRDAENVPARKVHKSTAGLNNELRWRNVSVLVIFEGRNDSKWLHCKWNIMSAI